MTKAVLLVVCLAAGCAGTTSQVPPEGWRSKLREAMRAEVPDRAARDRQSRLLADAVEYGQIEGLNRAQVRAAIGKGRACVDEHCSANDFRESDWLYEIGVATGDDVKQLPLLIIGFDHRDRAAHVWTLTTH